jgi:hypothetical protein
MKKRIILLDYEATGRGKSLRQTPFEIKNQLSIRLLKRKKLLEMVSYLSIVFI